MSNPGDLGNIIDSTWTFGGERWDVGLESAEKLLGIVDEFGAAAAEDLAALGGGRDPAHRDGRSSRPVRTAETLPGTPPRMARGRIELPTRGVFSPAKLRLAKGRVGSCDPAPGRSPALTATHRAMSDAMRAGCSFPARRYRGISY